MKANDTKVKALAKKIHKLFYEYMPYDYDEEAYEFMEREPIKGVTDPSEYNYLTLIKDLTDPETQYSIKEVLFDITELGNMQGLNDDDYRLAREAKELIKEIDDLKVKNAVLPARQMQLLGKMPKQARLNNMSRSI